MHAEQRTLPDGSAWADHIQQTFVFELKISRQWVRDRFLPALHGIGEVAKKYEMAAGSKNCVEEESIPQFIGEWLTQFDQGFENLLFVHLFHLFEQQVARLVSLAGEHPAPPVRTFRERLQRAFEIFGFDPTYLDSWPQIEELHWIANTVKHPDADDSNRLKRSHPEWFGTEATTPLVAQAPDAFPVEAPMTGMDLYLKPELYEAKIEALVDFWEAFASVLRGDKPKPKSLRDHVFGNRKKIIELAASHGASNVRVFGSVARGDAGPASDVDMLVDFVPGTTFGREQRLREELAALLGRNVDLGTLESLKPRVKERVKREVIPL